MSAPSIHPALREVIERLASLERRAGSSGEAEAAQWLAQRLRQAGCDDARVEDAEFQDGYAKPLGILTAGSVLAGIVALRRRTRLLGGLAALAAAIGIADDVSNGPRLLRRLSRARPTQNVIATAGDPNAERTLVVLAHHDAAPTGMIFDPRVQTFFGEHFPGFLERQDTALPFWWAVVGGPLAVALGATSRRRKALIFAGIALSLISTLTFADVARSPVVPGANDNLSAVAVLVALAEILSERPLPDLRVLLVSCGAEEVIQGGIKSFAAQHFPDLNRERTWFLTLETLGSPTLILLEGEGPILMEDYSGRHFRDLVAYVAAKVGAPVQRNLRARSSTDAVIPSRAGYPTATLASMNRYRALSNYHLMSDTPENIEYRTVARALHVTEGVARELATNPWV